MKWSWCLRSMNLSAQGLTPPLHFCLFYPRYFCSYFLNNKDRVTVRERTSWTEKRRLKAIEKLAVQWKKKDNKGKTLYAWVNPHDPNIFSLKESIPPPQQDLASGESLSEKQPTGIKLGVRAHATHYRRLCRYCALRAEQEGSSTDAETPISASSPPPPQEDSASGESLSMVRVNLTHYRRSCRYSALRAEQDGGTLHEGSSTETEITKL
eukprot:GHVT01055709.1.p1 GENE.GHVT01055709.1~~GHVT01055709.1.p1  ORF type:complete len:210 (-),score=2.91 GHVT01055709.1:157-786(-)